VLAIRGAPASQLIWVFYGHDTEKRLTDVPPNEDWRATVAEITTDALRFWERRRAVYNIILAGVVLWYFVAGLPQARRALEVNLLLLMVVFAVVANVLYCLAYIADIFVQCSGLKRGWREWRWVLFLIGTTTAGIITRFLAMGMFGAWHGD
jgi:hypothetical protein